MLNFLFSSIVHKLPNVVTLKADIVESYFYRVAAGCNRKANAESTDLKSREWNSRASVALLPFSFFLDIFSTEFAGQCKRSKYQLQCWQLRQFPQKTPQYLEQLDNPAS